jgi:hypothetical protein
MEKTIYQLVDELPKDNMTVKALRALDFVIPGEWTNLVGFEQTIKEVTGEEDQDLIQKIGERAITLYNDESQGYKRAMWLYETVDKVDSALGAAAMVNKIGQDVGFLGFLTNITPKPDKAQKIDLTFKLIVELLAYCQINGIPGDSIGDFLGSLADEYTGPAKMRMAAIICLDGLVPLGPNFLKATMEAMNSLSPSELEKNDSFKEILNLIPGGNSGDKLSFVTQSLNSMGDWITGFIRDRGLEPEQIIANLKHGIDIADDKLDYLGAFLDMTTNYFVHTGTQSLARSLIERAVNEI